MCKSIITPRGSNQWLEHKELDLLPLGHRRAHLTGIQLTVHMCATRCSKLRVGTIALLLTGLSRDSTALTTWLQ